MKTYEITREELGDLQPIAEGYKAIKWDSGCMQGAFRYGETGAPLVGKIFKVDGNIKECKWGIHFSKDPAYVFNFYEPLGYNRYFKIRAYGQIIDSTDGFKSVASVIEFVEEYDLMQYIDIIKRFDRTSAVSDSTAVIYSNAVSDSNAVIDSVAVSDSTAVSGSNAVRGSTAVSDSNAVRGSTAVSGSNAVRCSIAVSDSTAVSGSNAVVFSYGIRQCVAVRHCLFCYQQEGVKLRLFNKKTSRERYNEVAEKIRSFNWWPDFENWYDIKGNKEWWVFCFPQLETVDNDIAWGKMPVEMLEYIKSLPEFAQKVWDKITGK